MCLNDEFIKYTGVDLTEIQPTSNLSLQIENDKFLRYSYFNASLIYGCVVARFGYRLATHVFLLNKKG